ncbi:sialate O-acetylesterase [Pedobacter sp. MC2016-14]|uniref:sialate O-acetylesterase n=1 Tax=Pedobacter sp. MC2016-14 TaxID=2897327 RepID=UPI001E481BB1|nr:sialate O-acetylesterase [Pedobacter sp. MC2016-14]MCD0487117.1 sialate O-acetylesterase [Pedobacter sp. MC2016-14]
MKIWTLAAILLLSNAISFGQIKLPKLISNGMVLQRNETIKIWGWSAPNERISLKFNKKQYLSQADRNGSWVIQLPPQKAGGPYEMIFQASNQLVLKDILFGDVFLCSGQSNMELPMGRLADQYRDVIARSENTNIRQFLVPDEYDFNVQRKDLSNGIWQSANPQSVLEFSGVAYFFALEINKKYHIPVGIINAALGGSPAQSWMSENAVKNFPGYYAELQKFKDDREIKKIDSTDQALSRAWYRNLNTKDEGLKKHWKADVDDLDWKEMSVPGYWVNSTLGKANGVVWFKKDVNVPKSMTGKPVKLILGRIVDADSTFVNGQFVGTTSYQYPPRRYLFNPGILKEGKNTITVRIINNSGNGGFVMDKDYQLIADRDTIDLKGSWKYILGAKTEAAPSPTFVRWKPSGLYNAMIAPLRDYKIKAALWYQGEANTGNSKEYYDLMQVLVKDWRTTFGIGKLPFIYVQLPGFMGLKAMPTESSWAELREQQRKLLALENTAMAVAIDLGEWNDIHPLNKQDVGKRIALQAESLVYGDRKIVPTGPSFKSVTLDGNKLVLSFADVGKGLVAKGGTELKYFSVAGADRKFVWAKAEITGNKIMVWNAAVPTPFYVRYAWADNPEGANLYNGEGLPASPFEAAVK